MAALNGGSEMKQIDDPLDAVRSTKTAGEILFAICLVMAITIYLLNSTMSKQRELMSAKSERHAAQAEMIERLHSFKAKDAELFENLAIASIDIAYHTPEYAVRYPNLIRIVPTGPNRSVFLKIPDERASALHTDAHAFGMNATKAFLSESSPDERARKLQSLVSLAYRSDTEAALFLNTEVVPRLATIDSRSEWNKIAWWIASGEWPDPGGLTTPPGHGVTFSERFADPHFEFYDRYYVYDLLQFAPDLDSADKALVTIWQQSYAEQRTDVAPPGVSLPVLGLSMPIEAIALGAAPVLLLFQLVFLVHWVRQWSILPPGTDTFAFPAYACPSDPLRGPMPRTLADAAQRLIWMLFLALPTALISIGLLTRYDLVYPLGYFRGGSAETFFGVEQWARDTDVLSSCIDWVTLACVAVSALAVLNITRQRHAPGEYRKQNRTATLLGWSAAVAMAIACVWTTLSAFQALIAPLANASDVQFKMHYLAAFGVLWSLYFGIACQRRARLAMFFSIAGLVGFALHFIPI